MEARGYRYVLVSILISFTFQELFLRIMASEINHHIVYQTFSLGEGETVECYGRCDNETKTSSQKINISRCDGQKMRLDYCNRDEQVSIRVATLGKLSPDLDICAHKQTLDCAKDITAEVQAWCDGVQMCLIDVTNGPIRNKCGIVKYLAMDVQYACKPNPTTPLVITTTTTTKTTAKRTTNSKTKTTKTTTEMQSTIKITTKKVRLSTGRETSTTIISSPITTTSATTKSKAASSAVVSVTKIPKDTDSFWLMAAYNTICTSDFIKLHKGHLALVFLLSTFVGLVIFMCIYLDYCRRTRKKKDMHDRHCDEERPLKILVQLPKERIELNNKPPDMVNLKEPLSNHKFAACKHVGNCNNNNSDDDEEEEEEEGEEEGDVYVNASVATPFLKRNLEHKIFIHSPIDPSQGITSSTLSSMSLNDTLHSVAEDILPPPLAFTGDDTCSQCTVSTHVHPLTSLASNTSLAKKRNLIHDQASCLEAARVESALLERAYLEQDLRNKREHTQCEHVQLGRHITFEEYSRSLGITSPMECHVPDNYVTSSKYPSAVKHPLSSEVTSQHGRYIREPTRACKCKPTERPRSNSVQGEGKRVSNNNKCASKQHPKRARIHVMQKCDEAAPLRSCNQKIICSDNETSRRKRRCQAEYKRGCSCHEQGTSLSDLDCKKCRKSDASSNFNCCSSLTSNGQSSHDEDFDDNSGTCAFLSVSTERFKNEEFRVEESGYQTHDTGTDSLCSSSFSTDQEDSRMFLPASLNTGTHTCKSKSCHLRNETAKRDQKLLVVRDLNKSKLPRRLRRDSYTDPDVHQHNSNEHTSADVHSYDSSLDDASSKESVKKCQTIHKKSKHDCGLDAETRCNCMYVTIPSDAISTVDEVHL